MNFLWYQKLSVWRQELVPLLDESESGKMLLKNVKWAYSGVCEIMQKFNEKAQTANFSDFARWRQELCEEKASKDTPQAPYV